MRYILKGTTTHHRFTPKKHRFTYPVWLLEEPVSQAEKLDPADFEAVRSGVVHSQFSFNKTIESVKVVAMPRCFGYVFRPISLFLYLDKTEAIVAMIAEVRNTFGQTHIYPLERVGHRFETVKTLPVSPFFETEGRYVFRVQQTDDSLDFHILYSKKGKPQLYANMHLIKESFTTFNYLKSLLLYPFTSLLVFPRILYQAAKLFFIKKLPVKMSVFDRIGYDIRGESLLLYFPDNTSIRIGSGPEKAGMRIHDKRFLKRVFRDGEIGLGEGYILGEWSSPDIPELISFLIRHKPVIEAHLKGHIIAKFSHVFQHRLRSNTVRKSKENISEHYDLGNEFYSLFLDETMMYSSALFDADHQTLEDAQVNKVNRLIEQLDPKAGDHILETGSGWGYAAISLAERGCKVTTVTLSERQYEFVQERVAHYGLENEIDVRLMDYRHVEGCYDGVISIEMIEAVGHKFLPTYFDVCNRLLKPGGKLVIQAITYPDSKYEQYTNSTDFIRKHIFPGGHLPSLGVISDITSRSTKLRLADKKNIGLSYAETLRHWRERFLARKDDLDFLGYSDSFQRKWEYYLAYCEGAFQSEHLGCYQLTFNKERV